MKNVFKIMLLTGISTSAIGAHVVECSDAGVSNPAVRLYVLDDKNAATVLTGQSGVVGAVRLATTFDTKHADVTVSEDANASTSSKVSYFIRTRTGSKVDWSNPENAKKCLVEDGGVEIVNLTESKGKWSASRSVSSGSARNPEAIDLRCIFPPRSPWEPAAITMQCRKLK